MTAYGPLAHAALSRLTVDRLFLSADGVTELGLCEASPEQAWLKEAMVARALLDELTFGAVSRRERPVASHVPYTRHVDDHIIKTRDGLVMTEPIS